MALLLWTTRVDEISLIKGRCVTRYHEATRQPVSQPLTIDRRHRISRSTPPATGSMRKITMLAHIHSPDCSPLIIIKGVRAHAANRCSRSNSERLILINRWCLRVILCILRILLVFTFLWLRPLTTRGQIFPPQTATMKGLEVCRVASCLHTTA